MARAFATLVLVGLLPGFAAAQSADEALELLKLSLECSPSMYNIGDIVVNEKARTDISRPAYLDHTIEFAEAISGKRSSSHRSRLVARFADLEPPTLDPDPIREGHAAQGIRLECKAGRDCITVDDQRWKHERIYVCDRETADNAILALGLLIGTAAAVPARPATRSDVCVVDDPTGTPLNLRTSPGGPVDGQIFNGTTVTVISVTRDAKGRDWAEIRVGSDSLYVFKKYLRC